MALPNKSSSNRHPAYQAWLSLRYRCNNPTGKNSCYKNISYSNEWENFDNFWDDMGYEWREGLSIDRIDPSKNYTKDNCRWITMKQQMKNKKNNRILSFEGRSMLLSEWSESLGIKRTTITQRLDAYGWSVEKTLSSPVMGRN